MIILHVVKEISWVGRREFPGISFCWLSDTITMEITGHKSFGLRSAIYLWSAVCSLCFTLTGGFCKQVQFSISGNSVFLFIIDVV